MKLVKLVFMVLVLGGMAQGIWAQEKRAYIRPAFSFGFVAMEGYDGLAAISVDVDFVHNVGLTFALQGLMAWNDSVAVNPAVVGIGYTHDGGKWSAGGKILGGALALGFSGAGAMGLDINGTYWWKENLGFTGMMNLFFPEDGIVFSMRAGVSLKY